MKKLIIYPYDKETSCIARYRNLIVDYELVGVIGFKGWNINLKDASYFDGGSNTSINISEDFEREIEKCDTVLFLDVNRPINLSCYILKIEIAQKFNKEILVTKKIDDLLRLNNVKLLNYKVIGKEDRYEKYLSYKKIETIKDINTPIITIFSLGEHCNKFDISLSLRRSFLRDGYKVLQLGTKEYSSIFGIQKLPDFLFNKKASFEEKVLRFNSYIYDINRNLEPDIIIITVPGGIMPISNYITNNFGELSYVISNAVKSDLGIMSIYYDGFIDMNLVSKFKLYGTYALKTPINYINIANTQCDINQDTHDIVYLVQNSSEIESKIKSNRELFNNNDINIFNILNSDDDNVYKKIIEDLS